MKTIVIYWLRGFIASEATKDALAERPSRNKLEEYKQLIVYTAVNRSKYPRLQILATTSLLTIPRVKVQLLGQWNVAALTITERTLTITEQTRINRDRTSYCSRSHITHLLQR